MHDQARNPSAPQHTRLARFATACAAGALALALSLTPVPASAAPKDKPAKKWAEGRILVQPRAGVSTAHFDTVLRGNGGKRVGQLRRLGVQVVAVPPQAEERIVARLAKHPLVEFAELDRLVEPVWVPNDPRYTSQWHLPKIAAPSAWDTASGDGVVVAILDTGVDGTHPDLATQMVPGWNAYDGNADTSDVHGHGTWVAGVVAAATNNGLGVAAVAPDAQLMPVRISQPDGYAYWSTIANGLTWAADHGAQVANISYGVTGSSTVRSAAQHMRSLGGLVVVAAGNSGGLVTTAEDPAMISVSATTSSDARASWSSYGEYVDISAPGAGILTTSRGGGYSSVNGTSFASPCTAAVVALMRSANPLASPDQIETVLKQTALDLGGSGWDMYFGHGRVDAAAAVATIIDADVADTSRPVVDIVSPTASSVSGWVEVEVAASDNVEVSRVELLVDGNLLASDDLAPYQFSWNSAEVADGNHNLEARAFDTSSNEGNSAPVTVAVDNLPDPAPTPDATPPTVTIVSPGDGATVDKNVKIEVRASDDVGIALLQVYLDGELICGSNATELRCPWNTRKAASGAHTITAQARDAAGNRSATSITVVK